MPLPENWRVSTEFKEIHALLDIQEIQGEGYETKKY